MEMLAVQWKRSRSLFVGTVTMVSDESMDL